MQLISDYGRLLIKLFDINSKNPYGAKRNITAKPLDAIQINNQAITSSTLVLEFCS